MKYWVMMLLLICLPGIFLGQKTVIYQTKKINPSQQAIIFDSLSPIPGTLICLMHGDTLSSMLYKVDYIKKTILFSAEIHDSVSLYYQRLNFNMTKDYQIFDSLLIQSQQPEDKFTLLTPNGSEDIFGGSELSKKGSISRGITFGNQQNLGINSTLNLEMTGKLSENLNLLASVSDANIPIQPDGNTNKLQEFDQVFIQLYNERMKLIAGDFWIQKPHGYFLNYRKRGQGLTFTNSLDLNNKTRINMQSTAGLSKGKFQRQIIQGVENNQGPYRLIGSQNEPFIIVLSGTERVYIDGKLLERGQEFDYTIDYNTSELIFTSRNLITKDVRIVVEFQYSDQSYTRALLQEHFEFEGEKTRIWANYYQEQDLKNQPLQIRLKNEDKIVLANAGDSLNSAFINTIDSVGYQTNQNLYFLTDSLGIDSILVFSVHPDSAHYRATFVFVGAGKGDYVFQKTSAYGKVYRWVAPVGGLKMGLYSPVQIINSPKRKRMISTGIEQQLGHRWKMETEFSASENALNLFASKDRANDWGWANLVKIQHTGVENLRGWKTLTQVKSEYINANYSNIEPFRAVEFDRDWNTRNLGLQGPQYYGFISQGLNHIKIGKMSFQGQTYRVGENFTGYRFFTDGALKNKWLQAQWDASILKSTGWITTTFVRHRMDFTIQLKKLKFGIKDDQEFNLRDALIGLNSQSYSFFDYQFYLQNADSSQKLLKVFFRDRFDWRPDSTRFGTAARGTTIGSEIKMIQKQGNSLGFILGMRRLQALDTSLMNIVPDNSLIGRIEYNFKSPKGALSFDTYYEIGSGLEQKRNFIYLEVNSGQGVYAWVDYNADGVKDLNEFEISTYVDQANFIRIFTPSNEYQKTFTNEFNQSLFWRPEAMWGKKHGIKKVLSIFSNQLRLRSTRKISHWNASEVLNPFLVDIQDLALISSNYNLRNTFFILRTSSIANVHFVYNRSLNKTLLASGYDAREISYFEVMARWNITPAISVKSEAQNGLKMNTADYTQGRNYQLNYNHWQSEVGYQPNTNYRISLTGKLSQKQNSMAFGGELSRSQELGAAVKYNTTQKGSIQADVKYINLNFNGNPFSPVAFDMLEALKPGTNYTWSIHWQRNMGKNLQLNLQYLGRKLADGKMVHNGGMELRAFF